MIAAAEIVCGIVVVAARRECDLSTRINFCAILRSVPSGRRI